MSETAAFTNETLQRLFELQPHKNQDIYPLNDKGASSLFSTLFKNKCRYNADSNGWMFYNSKSWVTDVSNIGVSRCAEDFATCFSQYAQTIENDPETQKRYFEFSGKLYKFQTRETIIRDSKDRYPVRDRDFDKNPNLFNCQNGTIDLQTFDFHLHSPDDLLRKISNVFYDPKARSEIFNKYISEVILNDSEKTEYLQKILAYSLTGKNDLETCYILYGKKTRNGKGTLMETHAYMLGGNSGYAANMEAETLAVRRKDSRQASGDIARLDGCRFVNVSEPDRGAVLDIAQLKKFTGGDTITARHLNKSESQFVPLFKLFINTNFLPVMTDDTLFASNRINVITFDRFFDLNERDFQLKTKLREKDNISGYFNWCLEGLKKFYENGSIPPKCVQDATEEYRKKSDKIGIFFAECLEESTENSTGSAVYVEYQAWCRRAGHGAESKSIFYDELKRRGLFLERGTVEGKTYYNIVPNYKLNGITLFGDSSPIDKNEENPG